MEVDLRIDGNPVSTGYTPVTFKNLTLGVQYGVVVYWYGNLYIRYINDSNTGIDLQRYDLVTLNQSNPTDILTSMFEYVPASQAATLNIFAEFPNGTLIGTSAYNATTNYIQHSSGMWLTVTPPGQTTPYTGTFTGGSILPFTFFNGKTYTVAMTPASCGMDLLANGQTVGPVDIVWSHWLDNNNTDATRAITLNGNANYTAIYNQVTPAPCAGSVIIPTGSSFQGPALIALASVLALTLVSSSIRRFAPRINRDFKKPSSTF